MIRRLFCGVVAAAFFGAVPALADDVLEMTADCPSDVAFTFPSVTITPWAQVVVGNSAEFTVQKTSSSVTISHVGEAATVRFPSIVAVGSQVNLILDHPGTAYCIDSAVATVGGHIKVIGKADSQIRIGSSVGAVEAL